MPQRHPINETDGERDPKVDQGCLPETRGHFPSAVDSLAYLRSRIYNGEDIDGILGPTLDGALGSNLDSYSDDDDDEPNDDGPTGTAQWTGNVRRRRSNSRPRSFAHTVRRFTSGLVGSRHARPHLDEAH